MELEKEAQVVDLQAAAQLAVQVLAQGEVEGRQLLSQGALRFGEPGAVLLDLAAAGQLGVIFFEPLQGQGQDLACFSPGWVQSGSTGHGLDQPGAEKDLLADAELVFLQSDAPALFIAEGLELFQLLQGESPSRR